MLSSDIFSGIPLNFFPGWESILFLGGMFVDQTIFHSSLLDKLFFSNFMQNKLFFLKKSHSSPQVRNGPPLTRYHSAVRNRPTSNTCTTVVVPCACSLCRVDIVLGTQTRPIWEDWSWGMQSHNSDQGHL